MIQFFEYGSGADLKALGASPEEVIVSFEAKRKEVMSETSLAETEKEQGKTFSDVFRGPRLNSVSL